MELRGIRQVFEKNSKIVAFSKILVQVMKMPLKAFPAFDNLVDFNLACLIPQVFQISKWLTR